ncbi:MAG: hypothetical protein R3345_08155 [Fulvivirga sp.]|nr:hypothetical protein [Fulvivirga sp.]
MKRIFKVGDRKHYNFTVKQQDIASFHGETVHSVCSTFALAREIEWSTRLFVLEIKEEDEEGVGTALEIRHLAPAFVGEKVNIAAEVTNFDKNELICNYVARVGDRVIAEGHTGQKILKKEKLNKIFSTFK